MQIDGSFQNMVLLFFEEEFYDKSIDLLIVDSLTHGLRPTEAIMNYLKLLPADSLEGIRTAAFDFRISSSDIGSPVFRFSVKKADMLHLGLQRT
ncbi:MAG: hypothetical protein AAGU75_21970 [Bacillota bacterium]